MSGLSTIYSFSLSSHVLIMTFSKMLTSNKITLRCSIHRILQQAN